MNTSNIHFPSLAQALKTWGYIFFLKRCEGKITSDVVTLHSPTC